MNWNMIKVKKTNKNTNFWSSANPYHNPSDTFIHCKKSILRGFPLKEYYLAHKIKMGKIDSLTFEI